MPTATAPPSSVPTFRAQAPILKELEPVLEALGLDPAATSALGEGGPPGHRIVAVHAGQVLVGRTFDGVEEELAEDGALLLCVPDRPSDRVLAKWRDAIWPTIHVGSVVRCERGRATLVTIGKSEPLEGNVTYEGALLVGRRRTFVTSQEATIEKFDRNAEGWDGTPGGAGYPHFRWMRRYVGHFVDVPDGARILDFGCGAGWVGLEAARGATGVSLCAFDPSPEMIRITRANAAKLGITPFEGRVGFGEDPPFPAEGEELFDLVLSSGVVSFSPDLDRWLDGLSKTVRPGGDLVVGDIHPRSRGFLRRRRRKPLLPVRELNARTREEVRQGLEARGFHHVRNGAYQLSWPIPEAMHLNEKRLRGALTQPLLWMNRLGARLDSSFGSPLQDHFDSWVMHLTRPE